MKATLVKERGYYDLYRIDEDGKKVTFASTEDYKHKLSKQNCDEIFGVVDVEKLVYQSTEEVLPHHRDYRFKNVYEEYFREGFNKAIELNKAKMFTFEDMRKAILFGLNGMYGFRMMEKGTIEEKSDIYIQSLQQPTEIAVEIVYERDCYSSAGRCDKSTMSQCIICTPVYPLEDENGCLILKRVE
jgi:hypothetical protein